jgi:cytochrome c oxidase subunit II
MGSNSGASIVSRLRTLAAAGFALIAFPGLAFAQDTDFVDLPHYGQLNLHHPVTKIMDDIVSLHNLLLVIISIITVFVLALLVYVMVRFRASRNPVPSQVTHNTMLEVAWTVVPIIILIIIAIPSFKLLYFMDRTTEPGLTIKITGKQWNWQYEYPDLKIDFEAFMVKEADWQKLSPAEKERRPRLLAVDNEMVVPVDTNVRFYVTSTDVMHSWAVPAFGVKHDAMIGRLNQGWFNVRKIGLYYGQCSQICGSGHAYMPIAVRVVSKADFEKWVASKKAAALPAPTEFAATDFNRAEPTR